MKKKTICLLLAAGIISTSFVVNASEPSEQLPEKEESVILEEIEETDTVQSDAPPDMDDELLQGEEVSINEENFPDEILRNYVQKSVDLDKNGSLSEEELLKITSLDLSSKGLKDAKGIEYFSALTTLNCNDNQLTSLDISQYKALKYLVCANNQLTTLEIGAAANKTLEFLACPDNQLSYVNSAILLNLKTLNVDNNQLSSLGLPANLTVLYCNNNQLSNLDVFLSKKLQILHCSGNQLTKLDVSKNTALTHIGCEENQLNSIDISTNTALESLSCWSNNISELNLRTNIPLKNLLCSDNKLNNLDLSTNINLEWLKCDNNQLGSLDLKANDKLKWLNCSGNQLSCLDVSSKNALTKFECENNVVTADSRKMDMRLYDKNFDAAKVSNPQNLTLNENILTLSESALSGCYVYDCGKDLTMNVTIELDESGLVEPTATPGTSPTPAATLAPQSTPTIAPTQAPNSTPTSQPIIPPTSQPTATPASQPDETPTPVPSPKPTIIPYEDDTFSDVEPKPGNWKYESIKYVYENGIMNGISGTTKFEPDETLNRAMFATVLYRMVGSPDVQFRNQFEDVKAGSYYSNAVIWAFDQGIVQGLDGGKRYGVNEPITREQIAKMLNKYGEVKHYPMTENADLNSFPDREDVSGWATGYMQWAVGSGMITGRNVNGIYYLDPKGNATRAECSAMLMRFLERYK